MARFALIAVLAAIASTSATSVQTRRTQAAVPACNAAYNTCVGNAECNACLNGATIPAQPADVTSCVDMVNWFGEIVSDKKCDAKARTGPNDFNTYLYCLYDSYSLDAGLKSCHVQILPICQNELTACDGDAACAKCLAGSYIPHEPDYATTTTCTPIVEWKYSIESPAKCDPLAEHGVSLLTKYVYCLYDAFSYSANLKCADDSTLAPTAAPTMSPTGAPTAMTAPTARLL